MAELLLRAAGPRTDLQVHSAGLRAMVGHPIDRGSASALGQLGIDPSRHRARQFEPWMATDADLVLTAERAHRDQIMTEVPVAFRRTFTLKEFVRLACYITSSDARAAVAEASANRASVGGVPLADDDLPDPYGKAAHHAETIARQLTQSAQVTLDMLSFSAQWTGDEPPMSSRS
jgi:protein-tyrosine phosphatase